MRRIVGFMAVAALMAGSASAQVTPAAGFTPPDDTPSIRVGLTVFTNYTYQTDPKGTNADGSAFNFNAFDLTRTYINVTGNVNHYVAFRVTPDITRETNATPATSGSLVFRIKYGFLQLNLDDYMTRGSWVRLGVQQTPLVDYEEGIYRYRFQGTTFAERVGKLSSSDAGASFHYNLPSNYGEVHVGFYNGENYNKAELNDQKAFQFRGTVRPFATNAPILRGIRATLFVDTDHVVSDAERKRLVGQLTFEHKYVNAGFDYLKTHDQSTAVATSVESQGWSVWATPKMGATNTGWEGLLRYDTFKPNTVNSSQKQNRAIVGIAYWFPHPAGNATTALLFDYDSQMFDNIAATAPAPTAVTGIPVQGSPGKAIAVHALINF